MSVIHVDQLFRKISSNKNIIDVIIIIGSLKMSHSLKMTHFIDSVKFQLTYYFNVNTKFTHFRMSERLVDHFFIKSKKIIHEYQEGDVKGRAVRLIAIDDTFIEVRILQSMYSNFKR